MSARAKQGHVNKFTIDELRTRLLSPPQNAHHPLPRSRWDKNHKRNKNRTINLNARFHTNLWHEALHGNMLAKEIAAQWSIWWALGCIFLEHRRGEVRCNATAPGTLEGSRDIRKISRKMSLEQQDAWDELFGLRTPPDTVIAITNELLLPHSTPIEYTRTSRRR